MLGGAYGAKVLPLRVLGKCGGYISDISNAILYATNQYPGLTNPNKADIINMSLGGYGACRYYPTMQSAINTATNNGAVVVVAAGNSGNDLANYVPASCDNVISVAASGIRNELSWYSNYGNATITASGGNDYTPSTTSGDEIYSTLWEATTTFSSSGGDKYVYYEGTSMAAPHVSAALADIISLLKQQNKSYNYAKLVAILQNSASFNYYLGLNSNTYGSVTSGILNAYNALKYASNDFNIMLTKSSMFTNPYGTNSQNVSFANNQTSSVKVNLEYVMNFVCEI